MKPDKELLEMVAGTVADGSPVDWDKQNESGGGLSDELRQLQLLEKIAAVHRSPSPGDGAASGDMEEEPTRDGSGLGKVPEAPELKQWGPLQIQEKIGQGGFGEVYRAHDPSLQRDVALKLLRPALARDDARGRNFLNEARRLARVRHPNVVVVHGADRHEGRVGLWTDLLSGKTLEESLKQQGPFGPEEAALIGIDLCRALAAVHAAGLLHRDIKTANVMREKGGRIVLLDFSTVTERPETRTQAEADPISGTPLFMAPELLRGAEATVASDIYSLGVVLYRLVTGRFPVQARNFTELTEKHDKGKAIPLRDARPDLPHAYVQVVQRALAQAPAARFDTIGEMETALASAIGSPVRVDTNLRKPVWWRRPMVNAAFAASPVLIVALLIAGYFFLNFNSGPLDVKASLYRVGDSVEERLLPGSTVSVGDRLFLEIEGSERMHVYVLNEDQRGSSFVLFPLEGTEEQNPLLPGKTHRLPGTLDGVNHFWEVNSAGGEETFLVIVSRRPLTNLERDIAQLHRAGEEGPAEITPDTIGELRGLGGLAKENSEGGVNSDRPISGIMSNLSKQAGTDTGLWVWAVPLRSGEP